MIASTRELPTANDDVIDEAAPGQDDHGARARATTSNPFPDKPLKVTTAVLETGQGDVDVAGDQVQVTPDAKFFGTMVVRYRVQDATGDPDREVEGRIRLTVQGKPDAPGTPTVSSVQDRTVVLSWTPPANNGAEITRYLVSSTAGDYEKECARDHLHARRPDEQRRVQLHRGRRRTASARPTRRRRPRPRAPTRVPTPRPRRRWSSATGASTVVVGHPDDARLPGREVQPRDLAGTAVGHRAEDRCRRATRSVWDGLENGVAYQVRVQALNRAPEPSSWSAWSVSEIPARAPDAAGRTDDGAPAAGGRRRRRCRCRGTHPPTTATRSRGTSSTCCAASSLVNSIPRRRRGRRSQAVVVDTSTTDYTFRVRAQQQGRLGQFERAPRRRGARSTPPGAPTNVQPRAEGDRALTVTYSPARRQRRERRRAELRVHPLNDGGWQALAGNDVIGGLDERHELHGARPRRTPRVDGVRYDGRRVRALQHREALRPGPQPER